MATIPACLYSSNSLAAAKTEIIGRRSRIKETDSFTGLPYSNMMDIFYTAIFIPVRLVIQKLKLFLYRVIP